MTDPNDAKQPSSAHRDHHPVTPTRNGRPMVHFLGGGGAGGLGSGRGCGAGCVGVDFCPQSLLPRLSGGLLGCEGAIG